MHLCRRSRLRVITAACIIMCCCLGSCAFGMEDHKYRYAPHNDVSVNDGPHIRRWSPNIIIHYNTPHCVTIAYSIKYSNMLDRFVA
jgi:hypothetical protein